MCIGETKGAVMIVFKVEYDLGGGVKSRGARYGHRAIERAFYDYPWRGAENGFAHPETYWTGSLVTLAEYRKEAKLLFAKAFTPFISLSGDNSCSFETVRIVAQYEKPIALVVLDAHPDACDFNHDPHAFWVRKLWDKGIVAPQKTVFFGIRDPEEEEMRFLKEKRALMVTPDKVDDHISYFRSRRNEMIMLSKWKPFSDHALVIVVDIDVLDPVYAPGTGILRSGGLNVRQVLNIIRRLCALPFAIKIGEICEVIPEEGNSLRLGSNKRPDPCGLTVLAAEAILREMLHVMQPT